MHAATLLQPLKTTLRVKYNHQIEPKRSAVRTLLKRADVLVTKPQDKSLQRAHVKRALRTNQYEYWAFEIPRDKPKDKRDRTGPEPAYAYRTSLEHLKKTGKNFPCARCGRVPPLHKHHTFVVGTSQRQNPDLQKCGVVYQITCPQCQHLYVGETGRTLATRMKDHTSHNFQPTAVGDHCRDHGHVINMNNVVVLAREEGWIKRKVHEAIEIKTIQPTINRDQGFDLPAIYSEILPVTRDCSRQTSDHPTLTNRAVASRNLTK